MMIELIKEFLFSYGYHVDIEIKTSFTEFVFDVSPEHIMNQIDSESSKYVTDDYDFIITEGLTSYFWLHTFIPVPLICINPMNDPQKEFWTFMTDEIANEFDDIDHDRIMHTKNSVCVLTNDEYALHIHGDEFNDKHLIISDYKVMDREFWFSDEMKKAIDIILSEN